MAGSLATSPNIERARALHLSPHLPHTSIAAHLASRPIPPCFTCLRATTRHSSIFHPPPHHSSPPAKGSRTRAHYTRTSHAWHFSRKCTRPRAGCRCPRRALAPIRHRAMSFASCSIAPTRRSSTRASEFATTLRRTRTAANMLLSEGGRAGAMKIRGEGRGWKGGGKMMGKFAGGGCRLRTGSRRSRPPRRWLAVRSTWTP